MSSPVSSVQGLLLGNFPGSHLQSLSLLLTEPFLLAFCASQGTRGIYLGLPHLWITAAPPCPLVSWTQGPPQGRAPNGPLGGSSHLPNLEGGSCHGIDTSTSCPFNSPVSIAHLPNHMAGPLAAAHASVKTQTWGLLPLLNSPITARETACSSLS